MKKDEKMNTSGKKKVEAERLGMGLGNSRRYVRLSFLGFQSLVQFAHCDVMLAVFIST
jgi:hypothetical protein